MASGADVITVIVAAQSAGRDDRRPTPASRIASARRSASVCRPEPTAASTRSGADSTASWLKGGSVPVGRLEAGGGRLVGHRGGSREVITVPLGLVRQRVGLPSV